MSHTSVLREIARKREYAAQLEARATDPAHQFTDPEHRRHLMEEARRQRDEADREEAHLASHSRPHVF
jgi:hypothetical protein